MHKYQGLSLLELLITVAILGILVIIGAPSVVEALQTQNLRGATENTYFSLLEARSTAISKSVPVVVDFSDGANWCLGVSDAGDCDCAVANSCQVDGVEKVLRANDFNNVTMTNLNFGANDQAQFDAIRGAAVGNAGTLELTDGTNDLRVILSNLGRVRICVAAGAGVGGYPAC